jgi:hypothetical protein
MKNLQVKSEILLSIEVPDEFEFWDLNAVTNKIQDWIQRENTTEQNLFYENLEVICSDCGVSLSLDEEQESGLCVSCENKEV